MKQTKHSMKNCLSQLTYAILMRLVAIGSDSPTPCDSPQLELSAGNEEQSRAPGSNSLLTRCLQASLIVIDTA